MTPDLKSVLLRQHEMAWALAGHHLDRLTTEACLWRPGGETGLHVWQQEDGRWRADWPESEGYEIGPASLGWISWHMIFWWRMVLDQSFGDGRLTKEDVIWPGSADGVRAELSGLHARWMDAVTALDEAALAETALTRWPFRDRPFADIVAWANTELTKSAAEMGYVLFLRGRP